ncbi:ribokinase [Larsenimonas salina]|uniref:ribokinase n=1 Tax=Larsenimonas salina TaxID=1295565 RepID=UPI002074243D|nr:ribokinase [Larsenimonas salina]MCM5705172.1 ribokinase [Larsenimonas salina]
MTTPTLYNYGSINIDHVYRVPHLVKPGETLSSTDYQQVLGGKGANQSVAAARAGGQVAHWGQLNAGDQWALDVLDEAGVDTQGVARVDTPSGHALIQVDDAGENSIVLFGGANQSIDHDFIATRLAEVERDDWVLLQNECSHTAGMIEAAHARGLKVAFNPAPMTRDVTEMALDTLSILFVNRGEGAMLAGLDDNADPDTVLSTLAQRYPDTEIILTLGADGVYHQKGKQSLFAPAEQVDARDTTAAGDTFIGYFMAARLEGKDVSTCLKHATRAAAYSVQRAGAHTSIPRACDLEQP